MKVAEISEKTAPILKKHGIKRAAVFGSVSRGDDRPDSDIDLFVTLGKPMGLIAFSRLVREIEEALRRKVDVVTESSLNKYVRPHVLPELKTIYEG